MLNEIQIPQGILSTLIPFGPPILSGHFLPNQPLHFTNGFVDDTPFSESTTQWLTNLLDMFTDIVRRNDDLSQVELTETDYEQMLGFLDDLVYNVGDDENHPLSATMTQIGVLIKAYEDHHFAKMDTLFPELTKERNIEIDSNDEGMSSNLSGNIDTDFVIVLFSIGCLFWKGGIPEKAINAFDIANSINSDFASIYISRGEARIGLNDLEGAKADLQYALKLAERQGEEDFRISIKNRLNEFDIVEVTNRYLADTKFSKLSVIRECRIQLGTFHSRADMVLRDALGKFITIIDCKKNSNSDNGESSHEPLKSYLCATDTQFGIFASSINPDSWIFYENLRHNRFQQITRADFEEQVLAKS